MRVLITGGNGFVGLNTVQALTSARHDVTALVRHGSNTSHLEKFSIKLVRGDLRDQQALCQAMEGLDAVIHTAGFTGCKVSQLAELIEVNTNGTKSVCQACLATGVKRLVFTSTTSTIGAKNGVGEIADETTRLSGFRSRNPYGVSKILAEQHVRDAVDRGLNAVILNPAEVIGPYDYNFQWGRLVLAVAHNQLPFVPPGGASFCDGAAVGQAHVGALTRGQAGERYILAGSDKTFSDYIETIERQLGTRAERPGGSYRLKYASAWMSERVPGFEFLKPAVEAYRMKVFAGHYYFSSAKAVAALGYREVSLEQMVESCIQWYQSAGILPGKAA